MFGKYNCWTLFQPQFQSPKEQCPHCPKWSNSADNVNFHISKEHSEKSEENVGVHTLPSAVTDEQESISEEINESIVLPSSLLNCNQLVSKHDISEPVQREQSKTPVVVKNVNKTNEKQEMLAKEKDSFPLRLTTNFIKDTDHNLFMDWDDSSLDGIGTNSNCSPCLNVNEDIAVRLDNHNKDVTINESSKSSDNLINVESQCMINPKSSIRRDKRSVNPNNEKNNYGAGYVCSFDKKEAALAVQQLDTEHFVIDLGQEKEEEEEDKPNIVMELFDNSNNEENSCEGTEQSLFVDIINEYEKRCKVEEHDENKSMRISYKHHTELFKDDYSSDDYDDPCEDEAVKEENLSVPDTRSSICELQEKGLSKSVKNYLKRPGIKIDR